ncbi:hypothetical protein NQZ68_012473 [Dissostichus eleginoides]|nr:hypothetical protein NQZ68_012473 [Dissostichus eleginoides]
MLEHRTKLFGRSGKICGNTLQKSFLEWTYAKFEVERLSQVQHFQCPSCTPSMLAVAVDGSRKLYRFKSQPGPCGFFDGVFLAKDTEVSSFVDYIHGTTRHNPAKGRCGSGQWSAARETANKSASKLDEEGVEVATVQRITEATEDLEKLTAELSLQDNQVQHQNDLQKTIEGLYLSIKQQKCQLYRQSGGNKRRHKLRKKIAEEKKALEDAITEHTAVVGEADKLPPPNELLAEDNYSWKWECHGDMVQKQKVYDKVMLLTRLKEEAVILVHEVKKHWEYMRSVAGKIDHLSSQLSEGITGQSSTEALTERGHEGLLCVQKKQLHKVKAQQAMAHIAYQCILGQQTVSPKSNPLTVVPLLMKNFDSSE